MQFVPSLKLRSSSGESRTLAIPIHYIHKPFIKAVEPQDEESVTMSPYNPGDETLMIHTALNVRKDLLDKQRHNGFNVSENEAIDCIPEPLYMFIRLLFGGVELLQERQNEVVSNNKKEEKIQRLS